MKSFGWPSILPPSAAQTRQAARNIVRPAWRPTRSIRPYNDAIQRCRLSLHGAPVFGNRMRPPVDFTQLDKDLLGRLWTAPDLWDTLAYLCDACHGRFAGTDDERRAQAYLVQRLQTYGLDHVALEPFTMRGWTRGQAWLTVLDDGDRLALPCIALPGSPGCDFEAEVVDVGRGSAEDYARLGPALARQIALHTAPGVARPTMHRAAAAAGAAAFIFGGAQPGLLAPTGSVIGELPAIG